MRPAPLTPTIHCGAPSAPAMEPALVQSVTFASIATGERTENTVAPRSEKTATTSPASATARTLPTCAFDGFQATERTARGDTAPAPRVWGAGPHPRWLAATKASPRRA